MGRLVDIAMAKAAIQTDLVHVLGVAERDGLHRRIADAGIFWRHVIRDASGSDAGQDHQVDDDLERKLVGRFREDIRHGPRVSAVYDRVTESKRRLAAWK